MAKEAGGEGEGDVSSRNKTVQKEKLENRHWLSGACTGEPKAANSSASWALEFTQRNTFNNKQEATSKQRKSGWRARHPWVQTLHPAPLPLPPQGEARPGCRARCSLRATSHASPARPPLWLGSGGQRGSSGLRAALGSCPRAGSGRRPGEPGSVHSAPLPGPGTTSRPAFQHQARSYRGSGLGPLDKEEPADPHEPWGDVQGHPTVWLRTVD